MKDGNDWHPFHTAFVLLQFNSNAVFSLSKIKYKGQLNLAILSWKTPNLFKVSLVQGKTHNLPNKD